MGTSASTLRNRLLSRARLRHLHVFAKVAETLTVKRAAEAVGITQPSATQALAELEKLLECALFLRHSRGMSLTPAGKLLLPLARRAIGLVDDVATQAAALSQGATEVVRVAAISAALGRCLGRAIPGFVRAYPTVRVHLQEADVSRQASLITSGDVDCTFCRAPGLVPSGWAFTSLWPDRFAIVAGPSHPLAGKRRVSMAQLQAATWIVTPSSVAARDAFDAFFAHVQRPMKTYGVVTGSAAMMWQLLSHEPLLALVPHSVVRVWLEAGLLAELAWPERLPFGEIGMLVPQRPHGEALEQFERYMVRFAQ
jgi:DNA-binding transcriptional LysR family regulator